MRAKSTVLIIITMTLACALSACIYLPRSTTTYNADCGIYERQMTLQVYQISTMTACRDSGCATALAVFGAVSAASVVVSGSVVVAGNVVTWLERQGNCIRPEDRPLPSSSPVP